MKAAAAVISLLCGLLFFTGAAWHEAPVLPFQNFHVNDYADVIDEALCDSMLETALSLKEETGANVVVLTVESLGDRDIKDYADKIFESWEIGDGVLILFSSNDIDSFIRASGRTKIAFDEARLEHIHDNVMLPLFVKGDYAKGLYEGFTTVAQIIYEEYETDSGETAGNGGARGFASGAGAIFLAAMIVIVLYSWRVSARYRNRYGKKNYIYRRRSFERTKVRRDDGDIPSGFGGPGALADVIRAEDSGEDGGGDGYSPRNEGLD